MIKWMRYRYGLWQINRYAPDDTECCCGDSMENHGYDGNWHMPISQKNMLFKDYMNEFME